MYPALRGIGSYMYTADHVTQNMNRAYYLQAQSIIAQQYYYLSITYNKD